MKTTEALDQLDSRAARIIDCRHCGLPVPVGRIRDVDPDAADQEASFCCDGCETVYSMLTEAGAGDYYRHLEARDRGHRPAPTGRSYEEMNGEEYRRAHTTPIGDASSLRAVEFYLEGVHCGACVWLVERLPRFVRGVLDARLDASRSLARITFDANVASLSVIASALDRFGYPPHIRRDADRDAIRRSEERRHLIRIGVAFACAGNAMLLAFGLYGAAFSGIDDSSRTLLRGAGLFLALVSLLGPGRVFLAGAMSSLRSRALHMDVPVALALVVGTGWGVYNTLFGRGEVYFESITAVIFFLSLGRYLQFRQQRSAAHALELLYASAPSVARLVVGDEIREVALEEIRVDDVVDVPTGEAVSVDGELLAEGIFDQSLLTGESRPVRLTVGQPVIAGVINLGAGVRVRVRAAGTETRLGELMKLVERFSTEKPPIVKIADRFAHYFVITVLILAAVTLAIWWSTDASLAIEHAVALLIVTCPCSLGLATPLAVQVALGRAARQGILIKGGETIERLASASVLLIDKTGTVTEGAMRVSTLFGDSALLPKLAALERSVAHPIARALALYDAAELRVQEGVDYSPGGGVGGSVDGIRIDAGSPAYLRRLGVTVPEEASGWLDEVLGKGETPVVGVSERGEVVVVGLSDPVRADAREALVALRGLGLRVTMLSGDHDGVVRRVARAVGLDESEARAETVPEQKVLAVREELATDEMAIMVGDGINDAAAISAASVGVAVKGGAEASLAASDVYLTQEGLTPLVALIVGARRTVRVIRRNLVASLAYNGVSATLAIAGLIHPMAAAILMPLSSLTVVFLSYRSRIYS